MVSINSVVLGATTVFLLYVLLEFVLRIQLVLKPEDGSGAHGAQLALDEVDVGLPSPHRICQEMTLRRHDGPSVQDACLDEYSRLRKPLRRRLSEAHAGTVQALAAVKITILVLTIGRYE